MFMAGPRVERVEAWGGGFERQTPVTVAELTQAGVTGLAAGRNHVLAVLGNGTVKAWGNNFAGQLGDGTTNQSSTPVSVTGLTGVRAIAAGYSHNLAVSGGSLNAWGDNGFGQLGDGSTTNSNLPITVVTGLSNITIIAAHSTGNLSLAAA